MSSDCISTSICKYIDDNITTRDKREQCMQSSLFSGRRTTSKVKWVFMHSIPCLSIERAGFQIVSDLER